MKALLDTNIYISYLLPSSQERAIATIVEAAVKGTFTLLLPQELAEEFVRTVASKPYLAKRIGRDDASALLELLTRQAQLIPSIYDEIPAICRDAKDDYLLAYALVGRADYLVTGDEDLLDLDAVEGVKIVKPTDFAALLLTDSSR